LAPAAALALPTLTGVPVSYEYYDGDDRMYSLLRRFVELGVTTASTQEGIQLLRTSPLKFANASLKDWLKREGGDVIKEEIDYWLSIDAGYGDVLAYTNDKSESVLPLAITISCGGCGYLACGPIVEQLEARAKGLGRAWYNVLVRSCRRWMYVYDLEAARSFVECEKERMSEDPDGETWEIQNVEGDIPAALRKPKEAISKRDLALLRSHADSKKCGSWIRHVLEIHRLAQQPLENDCREEVGSCFDSSPCPCLLVIMSPNDNIEGCFNTEAEYMCQSSPEPNFAVGFDPSDVEQTRAAFQSLTTFIHINRELSQLLAEIKPLTAKDHTNDR
jgi:hypothetical protein